MGERVGGVGGKGEQGRDGEGEISPGLWSGNRFLSANISYWITTSLRAGLN
jgi:hypothetical protein